jgi:hypothetical protein
VSIGSVNQALSVRRFDLEKNGECALTFLVMMKEVPMAKLEAML